jgi:hypothetical protein
MPCAALAALMLVCLHGIPDTSKPVPVPRHCVKRLGSHVEKAKACAAENGVTWRIVGKRKKR